MSEKQPPEFSAEEFNQADLFNQAMDDMRSEEMFEEQINTQPNALTAEFNSKPFNAHAFETEDWLSQEFGLIEDSQLADGAARFAGVHPYHSYIVQAPAGSGKTSLLTQRFLALLSQVESPEQIVAMTFTKKAAAEMRERIIEALEQANNILADDVPLVEINTQKLALKALQRDAEKGWQLLQNPNRLRIKTIDGLNSFLVGQMPLLSKVGGQPQLLQDGTPLYQEAVREVLKHPSLEAPVGRLLRLVNGRFQRAENLLITMLAKRDQWMRTLIQYQGDEARIALQAAVEEVVSKSLTEHRKQLFFLDEHFAKVCDLADFAATNGMDSVACLSGAWPLASKVSEVSKWRALASWVLTAADTVRTNADKRIGFPAGKGEAKENKEVFKEALAEISQACADKQTLDALVALKYLPDAAYDDQQWQDLQWLIQLLTLAAAFLKLSFQNHGQADYIEIAQAASTALGTEDEPTDLAQQLDYQIQHLLVDEFQDTSSEQYRLLTQLIAGWQEGDGRSLFLVGDPMQSIYRFREAEVGNFLKAWQGKVGNVALKRLNLEVNFRSSAGVVNWVNQAFAKVLPVANDMEKGAVTYTPSLTSSKSTISEDNSPAVTPFWGLNRSADEEAQAILKVILERKQVFERNQQQAQAQSKAYKPQKIALLGRSRSSLTAIAQLLKRNHIGFMAVELESLAERQEVQDMVALSRALMHLADRAAWIAVLRSPLVGLGLQDLTHLIGEQPYATVWSSIACYQNKEGYWNFAANEGLSSEGVERLSKAVKVLHNSLQRLGSMPFASLLRETWLQLDGALTVENRLALENVDVFCQALAHADTPIENLQQLEQQIERLFARPDGSEQSQSIELMTMHKSKGLEFDTVILPGLGRAPRGDDAELVSWFQFMDDNGQEQLVIAPIDQKGQPTSLLRELLKSFEKEKQNFELGRLLYVAATRAKTRLYLFGDIKYTPTVQQPEKGNFTITANKNSLLDSLWPFAKNDFEQLVENYEPELEDEEQISEFEPPICRLALDVKGFSYLSEQVQDSYLESDLSSDLNSAGATNVAPVSSDVLANVSVLENSPAIKTDVKTDVQTALNQNELVYNQTDALLNTSVGNLVHAIFEQMVGDDMQNWRTADLALKMPLYQKCLSQQGLANEQMPQALERVQKSLKHAVNNLKFCWAMQDNFIESACELPLTSMDEQGVLNHIVDRTFVDEQGVRWIIDYKTSVCDSKNVKGFIEKQSQHYLPQLQRYGALFDKIEQCPQKWVLYFSYIDQWVELN